MTDRDIEYRLRQAARLLLPSYREGFDHRARFHAEWRMLIDAADRHALFACEYAGGITIRLIVIGAFEVNPNYSREH